MKIEQGTNENDKLAGAPDRLTATTQYEGATCPMRGQHTLRVRVQVCQTIWPESTRHHHCMNHHNPGMEG